MARGGTGASFLEKKSRFSRKARALSPTTSHASAGWAARLLVAFGCPDLLRQIFRCPLMPAGPVQHVEELVDCVQEFVDLLGLGWIGALMDDVIAPFYPLLEG